MHLRLDCNYATVTGTLHCVVSAQKHLQGSETDTRGLLEERKRKVFPWQGVINLASRPTSVSSICPPKIWLLMPISPISEQVCFGIRIVVCTCKHPLLASCLVCGCRAKSTTQHWLFRLSTKAQRDSWDQISEIRFWLNRALKRVDCIPNPIISYVKKTLWIKI